MSALPDDPDHFWRWLTSREGVPPPCPDPYCFVPRRIYGDYIASLLMMSKGRSLHHLSIVQGTCVDVSDELSEVVVTLDDGRCYVGDIAVLATGHDIRSCSPCYVDPWLPPSAAGVDPEATVLILGTGLTMVDYIQSLVHDGHRGPIVAMSRRGLLTKPHRRVDPIRIQETEVPFGAGISRLLRWLRGRVDAHVAGGGDWRSVIDGLRPYTQRLWRELPPASKRRFLEHARAWWDVHRHRMAPEVEERITHALYDGRLTLEAAKVAGIEPNEFGARVRYRRRGQSEILSMQVGAIVDCTGIVKDPSPPPIRLCAACSTVAWRESSRCTSVSRPARIARSSTMAAFHRDACLPWVRLHGPPSGRLSRSPISATNAPSLPPNSPTSARRVWPISSPSDHLSY